MQRALERHEAGEARVILIILRPVDWEYEPSLSKLQVLPTNAQSVTTWAKASGRDEAFVAIVRGIRQVIEELRQRPPANAAHIAQVWNVPFRRNIFFTGKAHILMRIHATLQQGHTPTSLQPLAISGLGGIGKSQVAIEYAYRYRDYYQYIFWVGAATQDTITADFVTIAQLLQLPVSNQQDQNITVTAVKHWLTTHAQWLLILDNADELALLSDVLPMEGTGHILLTTRARATGSAIQSIEVEKMSQEEGTIFLLRRAKKLLMGTPLTAVLPQERERAQVLVQTLDGLPLALDQAGAYLEETGCSLDEYLSIYQSRRKELLSIRDHFPRIIRRRSPPPSSFQKAEKASPIAAELLRVCAFLAPDAIPEEIITQGAANLGKVLKSVAGDDFHFHEALRTLRQYSLVRRHPATRLLVIHRLVQAVIKDSLSNAVRRMWAERIVRALNHIFPEVLVTNWLQCQRYLPHAQVCASLITEYGLAFPEAARLLHQTGYYLHTRARYSEAEALYQQALAIREHVVGHEHPDTATSLNDLARPHARKVYPGSTPLPASPGHS
jgi:hypothetical protein